MDLAAQRATVSKRLPRPRVLLSTRRPGGSGSGRSRGLRRGPPPLRRSGARAQAEPENLRIPQPPKSPTLGPSFWLSAEDSVVAQLKALRHNHFPTHDAGIEVLYRFAGFDPWQRSNYFGRSLDLGATHVASPSTRHPRAPRPLPCRRLSAAPPRSRAAQASLSASAASCTQSASTRWSTTPPPLCSARWR